VIVGKANTFDFTILEGWAPKPWELELVLAEGQLIFEQEDKAHGAGHDYSEYAKGPDCVVANYYYSWQNH
ncbi:MAG: hypothetical protein C0508_26925, partial [Cyanobacteria bacterium PR.023]|nr:hypothetical protein [Cyanobacteria bacterium PR.023]